MMAPTARLLRTSWLNRDTGTSVLVSIASVLHHARMFAFREDGVAGSRRQVVVVRRPYGPKSWLPDLTSSHRNTRALWSALRTVVAWKVAVIS